jgi:hypothetical protein
VKRIQVRPGNFVTLSPELARKAVLAFARVAFTREEVMAIANAEPRATTVFAGPLMPSTSAARSRTKSAADKGKGKGD